MNIVVYNLCGVYRLSLYQFIESHIEEVPYHTSVTVTIKVSVLQRLTLLPIFILCVFNISLIMVVYYM